MAHLVDLPGTLKGKHHGAADHLVQRAARSLAGALLLLLVLRELGLLQQLPGWGGEVRLRPLTEAELLTLLGNEGGVSRVGGAAVALARQVVRQGVCQCAMIHAAVQHLTQSSTEFNGALPAPCWIPRPGPAQMHMITRRAGCGS